MHIHKTEYNNAHVMNSVRNTMRLCSILPRDLGSKFTPKICVIEVIQWGYAVL
jgi:hypothetical protein